jgi:hypothetical protein
LIPRLKRGPDAIFELGHEFWLTFFASMRASLERRGLMVTSFVKNSKRYDYALPEPKVSFHVTPSVLPVVDKVGVNCWAASGAMVWGWKHDQHVTVEEIARLAGPAFEQALGKPSGLDSNRHAEFAAALSLKTEAPQSYTLDGILTLLKKYGPLWFITLEAPPEKRMLHARVVTGIEGDGTVDGTRLFVIDPEGEMTTESYRSTMEKFELVATGANKMKIDLPIQVLHP